MLWTLLACTPGFRSPPELASVDGIWLARTLDVRLGRSDPLVLEIADRHGVRSVTFPEARDHHVPVLGLSADDEVTLTLRAGGEIEALSFATESLPDDLPVIDVLASDPDRAEPGVVLFVAELVGQQRFVLMALDEAGEVRYAWDLPLAVGDARLLPDGTLLALAGGSAWRATLTGEILEGWGDPRDPLAQDWHSVDAQLTHEIFPLGDGYLSLSLVDRTVPDVPCSYTAPTASCGAATIEDARLVRFDVRGDVTLDVSTSALLDPMRIGYDSLGVLVGGALDWGHANGAIPRPDGGYLVSLRHQDALVALDEEGDLEWILANPDGWPDRLRPYLLDPEPGLRWPFHAHGPAYDADGDLWVFDNRNVAGTPYGGTREAGAQISRAVAYAVDGGAVRQVAEHELTATGPLYSKALGDVRIGPATGNRLAVYGMVVDQGGVPHEDLGFGSRAARFVEWAPDGALVRDVRVRSDVAVAPLGWRVYRAVYAPSLYP